MSRKQMEVPEGMFEAFSKAYIHGTRIDRHKHKLAAALAWQAENAATSPVNAELLEALKKSEALLNMLTRACGGNDKLPGCEEFYKGYNAVTYRVAGEANEILPEVVAAIARAEAIDA